MSDETNTVNGETNTTQNGTAAALSGTTPATDETVELPSLVPAPAASVADASAAAPAAAASASAPASTPPPAAPVELAPGAADSSTAADAANAPAATAPELTPQQSAAAEPTPDAKIAAMQARVDAIQAQLEQMGDPWANEIKINEARKAKLKERDDTTLRLQQECGQLDQALQQAAEIRTHALEAKRVLEVELEGLMAKLEA